MNGYACEWNQYLMRQISLLACLHNISWSLLCVIDYNITCRMHIEHSVMQFCAGNNALYIILQGLIMSCIKWNYIFIMFWWAFYALIQGVASPGYKIHGSKVMPFWPRIEASIPIITGLVGVVWDFLLFPWYWMPFTGCPATSFFPIISFFLLFFTLLPIFSFFLLKPPINSSFLRNAKKVYF